VADLIARETGYVESGIAGKIGPANAGRRRFFRWAVAAALVIASGIGGVAWHRHHQAEEAAEYLAANRPLFNQMIATCDAPATDDGDALPAADRDQVKRTLSAKLGRAVPVPDWAAQGWRLARAGVGRVGQHPAALLRYENGQRHVLLVSLPATAYTGEEGEEPEPYQYTVSDHVVCGLIRDGGLHCIVCNAQTSMDEVARLKIE
jgi:anti-sigma factor RsiW